MDEVVESGYGADVGKQTELFAHSEQALLRAHLCRRVVVVLLLDATLEGKDHGACGIDDLNVVLPRNLVGRGWLTMGTEQHLDVMELFQLLMVDGDEAVVVESFHLHAIVNDVAEAVERLACCQFFFRFADGSGHAEAKAAAGIYFYFEVHKSCLFAVLIILR